MVKWMCEASLKNRKFIEELYSLGYSERERMADGGVRLSIWSRELHGDKKSSPFPPRTQCFVPITAAVAVILLKLSLLPPLPR